MNQTCEDLTIGTNTLKRARKMKGMTQQNVADKANISLRHYQKFESGERDLNNASFRIGLSVCKALGIEAYYM